MFSTINFSFFNFKYITVKINLIILKNRGARVIVLNVFTEKRKEHTKG